MQLQPVRARWVFAELSNPSFDLSYTAISLRDCFYVVELKTNHRQDDNRAYADILNRIRIGIHSEFSVFSNHE